MENTILIHLNYLSAFIFTVVIAGSVLFGRETIKNAVKHQTDKALEDYKASRIRGQKAESIATLFALWIKYYGREVALLDKSELIEYYSDLNKLSMELVLWMDDVEVLTDVMSRLQNTEGSKEVHQIIGDVRKLLLEKSDDFDSKNMVLWPLPTERDNVYGKLFK